MPNIRIISWLQGKKNATLTFLPNDLSWRLGDRVLKTFTNESNRNISILHIIINTQAFYTYTFILYPIYLSISGPCHITESTIDTDRKRPVAATVVDVDKLV